ncbi:class I SAM-dependent methyltransferase [Shewanella waksmanii]|uniref:class I SAM-dependent methyltransferase n=1 Tax=Shewanella waksmanii TaxID=213783 RepID=UPI0037356F65
MSKWDSVASCVDFNLEISTPDLLNIIPTDSKILDFGCGYGRISQQLYSLGYLNLVGVDSSPEMINRGLTEFPHLDLRFSKSAKLPFRDNTFEAVITCAVFTCINDIAERMSVFEELTRVLKPQGIAYLAEFSSQESIKFDSGQGIPMWHSSHYELENLIKPMSLLVSKQSNTETMSGYKSYVSHIFAQKTPKKSFGNG